MDIIAQLSEMALGSRLKRLSDTMMRDVSALYHEQGIEFESRWYPVFYLLTQQSPVEITRIAAELGISHPAVSQIAKELEQHGLIESGKTDSDQRKRMLRLSEKGQALLPRLAPLWKAFSSVNLELLNRQRHNLLFAIEEMEELLAQKSHLARTREVLKSAQRVEVEIVDFKPALQADFKRLNAAWIEKYFTLEPHDLEQLDDPQHHIIDPGGHILLARIGEEMVGAVALVNFGDGVFELAKMAVDERFQGRQIGLKLGLAALERARQAGAGMVFLESNTRLGPALNLYRKLGFRKVAMSETPYARADIKMELELE
jgi:DNA-binding MarR family transcriptional regulator